MFRFLVRRAQRLWRRPPQPQPRTPITAASAAIVDVPTSPSAAVHHTTSSSVPASTDVSSSPGSTEVEQLTTLLSTPSNSSAQLAELSSLAYTNQRILRQIAEEKRWRQELEAKVNCVLLSLAEHRG